MIRFFEVLVRVTAFCAPLELIVPTTNSGDGAAGQAGIGGQATAV